MEVEEGEDDMHGTFHQSCVIRSMPWTSIRPLQLSSLFQSTWRISRDDPVGGSFAGTIFQQMVLGNELWVNLGVHRQGWPVPSS
jgi:hypothetical protein